MAANPSVRLARSKIPVMATLDDNDYCGLGDAAQRLFYDFFQVVEPCDEGSKSSSSNSGSSLSLHKDGESSGRGVY
jgi:hypothetical protein